jgi:hypothetical protein
MTDILEGTALRRHVLDCYSKKPNDWSFTISPSPKYGFYDALISSPDESWKLKIDSIFNPLPKIVGARVDIDHSKVKKHTSVSYGYRRLDKILIMKLMLNLEGGKDANLDSLLGPINPVVPQIGDSYAEGPYVFTNEKLSTGQKELEDKLTGELQRLMRNRLSAYG